MTREGEYFWYYELSNSYIAKTNTGAAPLGNFNPNDNTIRDLTWDGTYLWTINTSGRIRSFNKSGMTQETISGLLTGAWGLCHDGAHLWASDPSNDRIYQIALTDDETPPEPPIIQSPTHPVSTTWYSDPNPIIIWNPPDDPSGIQGYSYLVDGMADTEPDNIVDGTDTMAAYTLPQDGPWFFHCRARDGAGNWSEASHFRILIDTTPPGQGTIIIDDGADTTSSSLVTLNNLAAIDLASGMAEGSGMRFSNDIVSWSEEESYAPERTDWDLTLYGGNTLSGTKRIYVSFKDAAGNWSEAFFDDIVYNAPLLITTASVTAGTVGFTYADTLSASGGWPPYQWSVIEGALPPGLSLGTDGVISGEPESEGDFTFTVRVTDRNMYVNTRELSISVSIEAVKGDVNGDGSIDILDLVKVVRYILNLEDFTPLQIWAADVQVDGNINVLDALGIVNIILNTPMAKTTPSTGGATIWMEKSAQSPNPERTYSLVLDSPVPVAGIQISINLPQGSVQAPSTTSPDLTLSYKEENGIIRVLLYSLHGCALVGKGTHPLLDLHLADAAETIRIENVLIADEQGQQIPVEIKNPSSMTPKAWVLHQNYPNPFNPTTDIRYQVGDDRYSTFVTVKVFNLIGQEVKTLVNEYQAAGLYTVTWDGRDHTGSPVPSGVYFCQMETGETTQAIKMILSK